MITTLPQIVDFSVGLRNRGIQEGTVRAYQRDVETFLLSDHYTSEYALDVQLCAWVDASRGRVSAARIRRMVASAKAYLRHLKLPTTAFDEYRLPPLPTPAPHPVPGGIATVRSMITLALFSGATSTAIAVGLGGFAGLRISETCAVTPASFSADLSKLVVKGKGEKVREIPVSKELRTLIAPRVAVLGRTTPFIDMAISTARREITSVANGVGHAGVSSHDLRATFATEVFSRTNDLVLVARLLGHSNVQTTMRYVGLADATSAVEFG